MRSHRSLAWSLASCLVLASSATAQRLVRVIPSPGGSGPLRAGDFDLDQDSHGDVLYRGRVFSGANGAVLLDLSDALGSRSIEVTAVGDLPGETQDGITDFAAIDPGEIPPYVYLISGATGTVATQVYLGTGASFPNFVVGVGDANGDGFGDVIAGGDGFEGCPYPTGNVGFIGGGSGWSLRRFETNNPNRGYVWGRHVGDVTGDGLENFSVVRYTACSTSNIAVYHVLAGGGVRRVMSFPYSGDLCGLGDVNGDGFGDLAVVRPDATDPHRVVVLSGADESTLRTLPDAGSLVAGPGDVDGDGSPDLLASHTETTRLYSGRNGALLWGIEERAIAIEAVGDVDGDGLPDMGFQFPAAVEIWSGAGLSHLGRAPGSPTPVERR